MGFNWGKRSKARMEGVNPLLIEFAERLIHRSEYDLTIPPHGGVRTASEQKAIFDTGASRCDGYDKKSYHQSANALDIVIYAKTIDGMYDAEKLDYIGEIGGDIWFEMYEEGKLEDYTPIWGGSWRSFKDSPHWELRRK